MHPSSSPSSVGDARARRSWRGRSRPPARRRSAGRARRARGPPRGSRRRVTSSGLSGSAAAASTPSATTSARRAPTPSGASASRPRRARRRRRCPARAGGCGSRRARRLAARREAEEVREPAGAGSTWTEPVSTSARSQKIDCVPLPWCASMSTIATAVAAPVAQRTAPRSPRCSGSTSRRTRSRVTWWPGGRRAGVRGGRAAERRGRRRSARRRRPPRAASHVPGPDRRHRVEREEAGARPGRGGHERRRARRAGPGCGKMYGTTRSWPGSSGSPAASQSRPRGRRNSTQPVVVDGRAAASSCVRRPPTTGAPAATSAARIATAALRHLVAGGRHADPDLAARLVQPARSLQTTGIARAASPASLPPLGVARMDGSGIRAARGCASSGCGSARSRPAPANAITDVPGVAVGHVTVWRDEPTAGRPRVARTGVTAIVPGPASGARPAARRPASPCSTAPAS